MPDGYRRRIQNLGDRMEPNEMNGVLANIEEVLTFLKSRYPMFHLSNVFFRDLQYGIQSLLEQQDRRVGYREAEKLTRRFIDQAITKKILVPIDKQTWVLHYPEFRKPQVKPAAKPAAAAPPAPGARPQGAVGAKPGLVPAGLIGTQTARTTSMSGKTEKAGQGSEGAQAPVSPSVTAQGT
jgi:hypothetical protein